MIHWLLHFFGLDNPAGLPYLAWSGVVGSGLLGALHRQRSRHHKAVIAQAERHHLERQALATAQHNALLLHASKHHAHALDQAEGHHEALKAHLGVLLHPRQAAVELTPEQASEVRSAAARTSPRRKGGDH